MRASIGRATRRGLDYATSKTAAMRKAINDSCQAAYSAAPGGSRFGRSRQASYRFLCKELMRILPTVAPTAEQQCVTGVEQVRGELAALKRRVDSGTPAGAAFRQGTFNRLMAAVYLDGMTPCEVRDELRSLVKNLEGYVQVYESQLGRT